VSPDRPWAGNSWVFWALVYALALILSIDGYSLWTDEAFSAWLAGHRSFHGLLQSLQAGDSSDLQMGLYYVYLFFWGKLFGTGELALRLANIPFILIFSLALVWTSWRIFESRIAWLAAGMLPFLWQYAAEARPYMAIVALSAAAIASLLGFMRAESPAKARKFPWICLSCLLLGGLFHMLLLLAVVPLIAIAALYGRTRTRAIWREWAKPVAAFAVPFLCLAVFLAWTFHRPDIAYDYPRPGVKQMASVFYELAGLSGFGPNRKLSIDFRPYLIPVTLGGLALLGGVVCALLSWLRNRGSLLLGAFGAAACLSCLEAVALAAVTGKQPDARHLAALVPVFLILFAGVVSRPGRAAYLSMVLMGGAWLVSDIRLAIRPEYWKEDYRDAVAAAIAIHNHTGARIALAADPVAAGYYGLDVRGAAPCEPFGQSCSSALSKVNWPHAAAAWDAENWPRAYILSWLKTSAANGVPVAVLVQLDRSHRKSAWWPILDGYSSATHTSVHGFEIVLLPASYK
jgi:hypothetical protein